MTKEYKLEYPKFNNKFVTISNGYDKSDYENIIPKKMNEFTIVYAGKFSVSAGFRDPTNLFKAIYNLNTKSNYNIKFLHIGKQEPEIINIAKNLEMEKYCIFIGQKTYKETLSYCKGANVLAVIGGKEKNEQTGKIFDCIGCQKPILVLSNGKSELDDVCKKVKSAYVITNNNLDNIERKLSFLYTHRNILYKNEVQEYERKYLTSKLAKILNQIIEGTNND
jgi:hypothetical protein